MSESTGRYGRRKGGLSAFDGSDETVVTGGGRRLSSSGSAEPSDHVHSSAESAPADGSTPGGKTPQSMSEQAASHEDSQPDASKPGPANPGDSAKHGGAAGRGLQSKLDQASGLTSSADGVKNEGKAAAKSLAHGNTDDAANRGLDTLAGKGKGKGGVRDVASSAAKGALGTSDAGKAAGGQLTGAIAGAGTALTRNKTVRRTVVIWAVAQLLPIAMIAVLMMGVFATISGTQNAQNQGSQQNSADAANKMGLTGTQMAAFSNAENATNVPWEILAGVYLQQTGGPGCGTSPSSGTASAAAADCSSGANASCASPSTVRGSPPYALEATAGGASSSAPAPKRSGSSPATATPVTSSSFSEVPCPQHAAHALSPFLIPAAKVESANRPAVSNSLSASSTWVALRLQSGMRSKSMDLFQNQHPVDPSDVGGSVTYAPAGDDHGTSTRLAQEKGDWVAAIQNAGLAGMDSSAAGNAFEYGMALFQGHTLNADNSGPCDVGGGYTDAGTAAKTIMQYLVNAGLSPTQAAGLAGNWQVESQLNPKAVNPSGGAYGLVQWMGKRLADLHTFSSSIGKPYDELEAQLRYAGWELGLDSDWKGHPGGAYKNMIDKLKKVSDGDAAKAADIVDWYYEINDLPGQRGPSIPDREKNAKAFYNKFKGLKPNRKAGGASVAVVAAKTTTDSSCDGGPAPVASGPYGRAAVAAARHWLGLPYIWGAGTVGPPPGPTGPMERKGLTRVGFDCSGFAAAVVAVATHEKLRLTHLSTAQYTTSDMTTVAHYSGHGSRPLKTMRPGDVIVFNIPLSLGYDSHPWNHVGIYIGDGKMINAPKPGDVVRVDDIAKSWPYEWVARRPLVKYTGGKK